MYRKRIENNSEHDLAMFLKLYIAVSIVSCRLNIEKALPSCCGVVAVLVLLREVVDGQKKKSVLPNMAVSVLCPRSK